MVIIFKSVLVRATGGAQLAKERLSENGRFEIILIVILQRASLVKVVTETLCSQLFDLFRQVLKHLIVLIVINDGLDSSSVAFELDRCAEAFDWLCFGWEFAS